MNWPYPATFVGPITWVGKSSVGEDDDYNIDLSPPGPTILVPASQRVHTEFDSDETIDHFHTPWWVAFHNAVDAGSGNPLSINGTEAIVIGLPGLDCEHSCSVELHPVWAIAIHDPSRRSPNDDVWAIFVRNWGDEGYCSSHNQTLRTNSITFKLPWVAGATAVVARPTSDCQAPGGTNTQFCTNSTHTSWWLNASPNDGALVTFTLPLPDAEAGVRINGELHLQWSVPNPNTAAHAPMVAIAVQPPEREADPEVRIRDAVSKMTPGQRQAFLAKLQKQPTVDGLTPKRMEGTAAVAVAASTKPPSVVSQNYPSKVAADQKKREALCSVFEGKIPDIPDACK